MEQPIYQKEDRRTSAAYGRYDTSVITKLVRNYRSHSTLIELPNRLFYDGDLVSCGDQCSSAAARITKAWRLRVPLLWHGIIGADMREARSPSGSILTRRSKS